jgi:hypothetical protein
MAESPFFLLVLHLGGFLRKTRFPTSDFFFNFFNFLFYIYILYIIHSIYNPIQNLSCYITVKFSKERGV